MRTSRSSGAVPPRGEQTHNLKRISTMAGAYGLRNYTVHDIRELKGKRTLVETLAFTPEEAEGVVPVKGAGCDRCNNTGYKGRVGLYEVMEVSEQLRELGVGLVEVDALVVLRHRPEELQRTGALGGSEGRRLRSSRRNRRSTRNARASPWGACRSNRRRA